jgi:hypothetical protein
MTTWFNGTPPIVITLASNLCATRSVHRDSEPAKPSRSNVVESLRSDEKLTAFVQLQSTIRDATGRT